MANNWSNFANGPEIPLSPEWGTHTQQHRSRFQQSARVLRVHHVAGDASDVAFRATTSLELSELDACFTESFRNGHPERALDLSASVDIFDPCIEPVSAVGAELGQPGARRRLSADALDVLRDRLQEPDYAFRIG